MQSEASMYQPLPGFPQPVHDAQRVFRTVLDAMSHPGSVIALTDLPEAPSPLNPAAAAICLSLVDFETPIWADAKIAESGQAMSHLRFHCGCPVTLNTKEARTVLLSDVSNVSSFERFSLGTDERPDMSATIIIQVSALRQGRGMRLSGPGIKTIEKLEIEGVCDAFWNAVRQNNTFFPRGVDVIIAAPDAIACLPRTICVEG